MWSLRNFLASVSLFLIGTAMTTSAISPGNSWLYDTSDEDYLTSDISQYPNEKILQKIINTVTQYASDCPTHKSILIDLSLEEFKFPEYDIEIDLGSKTAVLDEIRVSELPSNERKSYSSLVQCESTRTAKIEVKLPKDLEIYAHLKVGEFINATSNSEVTIDEFYEGSISVILKNVSISKEFFIKENRDEEIKWKIHHSKSVVSVDVARQFQIPIYNKQQEIFDKLESPIKRFLIRKFKAEFIKSGTSVADICSKFIHKDHSLDDYLYALPNSDVTAVVGHFKSTGPIILDGLSLFNNTELTVAENKASSSDGNSPSYDDPEIKEIVVKIRTNNLGGRADYSYNSERFLRTFVYEFIEFEVKKRNVFQYENKNHPHGSYAKLNTSNVDIQVSINLGQMKAKIPKTDVIKNDDVKARVTAAHASILSYRIRDSFTKLLNEKLNGSLFVNCP